MKKLMTYAAALLCTLLTVASCSKQDDDAADAGRMGVLKMNISATRTEGSAYDPLDHIIVRVLNSEGGLLRKYTSLEDVPERLELLAGSYSVTVEAGEEATASFDKRYYVGKQNFEVVAGATTPVTVVCKNQSTVADVTFDETITSNFGSQFYAWVVIGESVDEALAEAGQQPGLKFTAKAKGYFTMPEGATELAWKFAGEHSSRGPVTNEGVIEDVKPGVRYKLTFRYSKDLPGFISCFAVMVDPSTDDEDDTIIFSPDPTISGVGFDMTQPQGYIAGTTGDKSYKITTIGKLSGVSVLFEGVTFDALDPANAEHGITAVRDDEYNATVTLSGAYFAGHTAGEQTLTFKITDVDGGHLESPSVYRIQGLIPVMATDYNLWSNSVTLRAMVVDPAASVRFELRDKAGNLQDADGVKGENGYVTATFAPSWEEGVNENAETPAKVYIPEEGTGVSAASEYSYAVTIGSEKTEKSFTTPAGDTIYNSGMELWSTYKVTGSPLTGGDVPYPNESSSNVYWVGGNNNVTNALCVKSTIEGANGSCAQLHPMYKAEAYAAGNLFTGTFDCATGMFDTYGYARFGVQYTFSARPRALRVRYNATITKIIHVGNSGLTTEDLDYGRIFVCVTNWDKRHAVQSGLSYDVNSFWDPATISTLKEGAILGYGTRLIKESTNGWIVDELPLVWYDKDAAPAAGKYSLVISCATSYKGDYMGGSTDNYLYIEDFEWVY